MWQILTDAGILGVTEHLDNAWVTLMARNLLMDPDGHTKPRRFPHPSPTSSRCESADPTGSAA